MSFTKYASLENVQILELKGSSARARHASLGKLADFQEYRTSDGYLYARIRAISSRVNKNYDGWPSIELAGGQDIFDRHHSSVDGFTVTADRSQRHGFSTFLGKPIFVDHHNSDPSRARGVIVDAMLHVDDHKTSSLDPYYSSPDVDPAHLPGTWIELLLEVDAKAFPKFAKAIVEGSRDPNKGIDGWSMGCDVEHSTCSICKNSASSPEDYCDHVRLKGAMFKPKGSKVAKLAYENCHGVTFFEISGVFDPADETALSREVRTSRTAGEEPYDPTPAWHHYDPYALDDAMAMQACPSCGKPSLNMSGRCQSCGFRVNDEGGFPELSIDEKGPRTLQHGEWNPEALPTHWGKSQEETITQDPKEKGLKDAADEQAEEYLDESERVKKKHDKGAAYSPYGGNMACPQHTGLNCQACGGTGYIPVPGAGNDGYITPSQLTRPRMTTDEAPAEGWGERRLGSVKLAENPAPQSEMMHAPEPVDTLRSEEICPVCGSSMDEDTCDVCGYQEPPEGFDNPDLTKAQDREQGEPATPDDPRIDIPHDTPDQAGSQPLPESTPNTPSNTPALAHVTRDMAWEVPHTAARINKTERPHVATDKPATNEPQETVLSDQLRPVTSRVRTAEDFIAAAGATRKNTMNHTADAASGAPAVAKPDVRTDVLGIGGVDQASNEAASKADAQVDVLAIGGTGVESVSADKEGVNVEQGDEHSKNIEAIHTDTWGPGQGDSLGQHDPVTSETPEWVTDSRWSSWRVEAYEDGPLEAQEQQGGGTDLQGGGAVKGVKPIAEQFGERVDVLQPVTSPSNNSGPTTTWSGTDGNGVTKQQDPVTGESIALAESGLEGKPNWSTTSHVFAAFKLADLEVEMGMLPEDRKYARAAELERETPTRLAASLEYAQRVRQAARKVAGAKKLPVMGRPTPTTPKQAAVVDTPTTDDSFMFGGL